MRSLTLLFLLGLSLTNASAEPTNFRVGLGLTTMHISPAPDYLPDSRDQGISIYAESPQSNNAGSRFFIYGINGDDDAQVRGMETQLMWGWGLAEPGWRLYTGPAWHWEKFKTNRNNHQVMNGWGWHIGTGYQFNAITVDIAATYRDPHEYLAENKRAGENTTPDSVLTHVLISYRF